MPTRRASVFVITGDDIRRSGATSLPEALRLAPNLQVARGERQRLRHQRARLQRQLTRANKLLVLIDGRSVYSPLFSGVFWDVQDVMLEDVERIEVISGPGGTLWGINAVNGVINVITQLGPQTQGTLVAGTGQPERRCGSALRRRYGAAASYRVYAGTRSTTTATEDGSPHGRRLAQEPGGLSRRLGRAATVRDPGQRLRGHASASRCPAHQISGADLALGTIEVSGANLTSRWTRPARATARLECRPTTTAPSATCRRPSTRRSTSSTCSSSTPCPRGGHALCGAPIRHGRDRVDNRSSILRSCRRSDQKWTSLFAQDEMALRDDLRLTLGARLERNATPATSSANARLAWKPAPDHLAVGRRLAHRARTLAPGSRHLRSGRAAVPAGGRTAVRSEIANVFELGYRGRPTSMSIP